MGRVFYQSQVGNNGMGAIIPEAETLDVYVELELALPHDHPCAMRRLCSCSDAFESVSRHADDSHCSLTIQGALADTDETRIEQMQQPCHEDECYYKRLDRDGFSADITEVTDHGVQIEAYVRSRELLTDVIGELSEVGTVAVRKIGEADPDSDFSDLRTVDVATLTDLERKTLRRAVESGYYDAPRQTSLGALADEFGVSKGTLSQRLRSAERKLVLGVSRVPPSDST